MLSLVAGSIILQSTVKVETINYRGWEQAVKVCNPDVEIIVVPEIGRVMHYAETGKPNVLWEDSSLSASSAENGYKNYGGDKVWYAPQSLFGWPPDPMIDGGPYSVEKLTNGVKITSNAGSIVPVIVTRTITLKPRGNEVTFLNSMKNMGPDRKLSIWQVTQVNDPDTIEMPLDSYDGLNILVGDKLDPKFHSRNRERLLMKRHPSKAFKFGTTSMKGYLKAKTRYGVLKMASKPFRRAEYPDNNSAQEIYSSQDPNKYVELEFLSPLIRMGTRQIAVQTVTWRIDPR